MRFKEFVAWCNERACDGYWGMMQAITCIDILEQIRKKPFWRREKIWREEYRDYVEKCIIKPINQMIEEAVKAHD